MRERIIRLGPRALVGVLSEPDGQEPAAAGPLILLLNAGAIHRVGPNRIYVSLARTLAPAGHRVVRFDFSGMGDSGTCYDDIPADDRFLQETRQVMDHLETVVGPQRFVLMGMCSGARTAYQTAYGDHRVAGVVGINGTYLADGELRALREDLHAKLQTRYYRKQAGDLGKWWRVITGQSDLSSILRFICRRWRKPQKPVMLSPSSAALPWIDLARRGVDCLLVFAEGSLAWDAFALGLEAGLAQTEAGGKPIVHIVPDADHVFTPLWSQSVLIALVHAWIQAPDRKWRAETGISTREAADAAGERRGGCG